MQLNLPEEIVECMQTIEESGFEVWLVGGCVRDLFLLKTPEDYDLASSAPPCVYPKMFSKVYNTGLKHGTVTVVIREQIIEITQFRQDGEYHDSRHPENVIPVKRIEQDLARRDFTMNAMAMNRKGELKDPFSGKQDLENGLVRAVGDPRTRFTEDALRILRSFRFASNLDFKIEQKTLDAALNQAKLLQRISVERIFSELMKTLTGLRPHVLGDLLDLKVLEYLGLSAGKHYDRLDRIDNNRELRFASLCFLTGSDPVIAARLLKSDKKLMEESEKIVLEFKKPPPRSKAEFKRRMSLFKPLMWESISEARGILTDEKTWLYQSWIKEVFAQKEPYSIDMLAVGGQDLKKLGIHGEAVGKMLRFIYTLVLENPSFNEKSVLLEFVKNHREFDTTNGKPS